MSWLLLLVPAAGAAQYEAEPYEIHLQDLGELFTNIEFSTGWLPDGSPVQFGLFLDANGGAFVEMDGTSRLTWPEPLTHEYEATPAGGMLELDIELDLHFDLAYDVGGFSGEVELGGRSISFNDRQGFTPWALPGGDERVEVSGDGFATEVFSWDYDIVANLISIYFYADVYPQASAAFEGRSWTTEGQVIEYEGVQEYFEPPTNGVFEAFSVFKGYYEAALSLVINPTFGVCIEHITCEDVIDYELPIDLVTNAFEASFSPIDLYHPLPWLFTSGDAYDFGLVEVDQINNWQMDVQNLGEMDLYGELMIDGDEAFTVFPESVYAAPSGGVDGVTVTFAPTAEGAHYAELILLSNDPATPDLRIPLSGDGFIEGADSSGGDDGGGDGGDDGDAGVDVDSSDDDGLETISSEVGCGCASARQGGAASLAWLALLGLVGLRRRRQG
jgi:MYXO-CTERM domain-containing protein